MIKILFICHGDILYAENAEQLKVHENSYIVVENGIIEGIYPSLPEQYAHIPVTDYRRGLIIPAFSDLHVHAPQYVQRGIGMDKLLSDQLNHYTFPQEARFTDIEYARNVYDAFAKDLIRQGTFHSGIFVTIHRKATDYLFRKLEEKGYTFNALVIDSMEDPGITLTPEERLERFCYLGDDRNIIARYLSGKAV